MSSTLMRWVKSNKNPFVLTLGVPDAVPCAPDQIAVEGILASVDMESGTISDAWDALLRCFAVEAFVFHKRSTFQGHPLPTNHPRKIGRLHHASHNIVYFPLFYSQLCPSHWCQSRLSYRARSRRGTQRQPFPKCDPTMWHPRP